MEEVDESNGPLHYYPKSHKLPTFEMYDLGREGSLGKKSSHAEHYGYYETFVEAYLAKQAFVRTELYLKKGQALIWSANLFHGGSPIRDHNRTRHSQVTHYYFQDCVYYTPLFSDPYARKLQIKDVIDVRTNTPIASTINGQSIFPLQEVYFQAKRFVQHVVSRFTLKESANS